MFSFFKRKKKDQQPTEQDVVAEESLETSEGSDVPASDDAVEVVAYGTETAVVESDNNAVAEAPPEDTPLESEVPAVESAPVETEIAETEAVEESAAVEPTVEEEVIAEPAVDAEAAAEPVVEEIAEVVEETEVVAPVVAAKTEEPAKKGFFARIRSGLSRTRSSLTDGLANLLLGKKEIDEDLLEELETQLIMADVGVEATADIMGRLTDRVSRKELKDSDALYNALIEELKTTLAEVEAPLQLHKEHKPFVILMVGINGVGKTTTIGKLARQYQSEGKSVMLAAGDTFRAAAVEQLQVWGERNNVPVVAQHTGADSASVIYDAVQAAQSRKVDVLIADTAGRLHNKDNLMQELEKVVRVMKKLDPDAPHEVMLVLDAGTGQNAINQTKQFLQAVGVSGLTLTKLDGTAKGGVIFALAKQFGIPVRFIGVGEGIEDLRPFQASQFIDALFQRENQSGQ